MIKRLSTLISIFVINVASAKDFGVRGNTFEIIEDNLLSSMQNSARGETINQFQAKFKKEILKQVEKSRGKALPQATEFKRFFYDPKITIQKYYKDDKGVIFAKKGQTYNPLKYVSLRETLIFIDGHNIKQVKFALKYQNPKRIIIANGSAVKLSRLYKQQFYFDYNHTIIKKLHIQKLPSVVFQKGEVLEINEIAL